MAFVLPFIELPKPFVEMLTNTYTGKDAIPSVISIIRANPALDLAVERGFQEFNDGRGLDKIISALGWPNFRERMASLYIHKIINGKYPEKTQMALVEDLKNFESHYFEHSVHSNSRIFLLALYLRIAELSEVRNKTKGEMSLSTFPDLMPLLNLSQARSEKLDWMLLILAHYQQFLGLPKISKLLASHSSFREIFKELPFDQQMLFHSNLLAYGMSIGDNDIFLYEKV